MGRVTLRRLVLFGCLAACLGATFAPVARAGDPPPATEKAEDAPAKEKAKDPAAPARMSFEDLEAAFSGRPDVLWLVGVTKYGSLLIGLLLLILAFVRWDKIRAGMLPAPASTPPPDLFEPGTGVLVALGGLFLLPFLLSLILVVALGKDRVGQVAQIAVMGAGSLPFAVLVVLRRRRLALDTAPRLARATRLGLSTFCIASVFVVPLTVLTALVLELLQRPAPIQDLVEKTLRHKDDTFPIVIAVYGVLIAPFVEESLFRGLLYPALKRWMGGTRRAAFGSALIVSALFAAVHMSATAFLGLFALALVLTYCYERTNSLAAIVIAHATNNLLSLAPLLLLRFT